MYVPSEHFDFTIGRRVGGGTRTYMQDELAAGDVDVAGECGFLASMTMRDRFRRLPEDWRAVAAGAAAASGLVLVALVVGLVEGGLLPWACRGLANLFTAVVLMYGAGLVVGWGVIGVIVHLTRRRWPTSTLRTWCCADSPPSAGPWPSIRSWSCSSEAPQPRGTQLIGCPP